jgi:hypothetical protein
MKQVYVQTPYTKFHPNQTVKEDGEGKGKGKVHPRTGHESPEEE